LPKRLYRLSQEPIAKSGWVKVPLGCPVRANCLLGKDSLGRGRLLGSAVRSGYFFLQAVFLVAFLAVLLQVVFLAAFLVAIAHPPLKKDFWASPS
jgi:hypothetical protein